MLKSVGIIGCGAVVKNSYVEALGKHKNISVDYVCDLNEALANEIAGLFNAKAVTKDVLLQHSDIVIIATPPSSHYSLIMDSLRDNRKIVCEKPFVGTIKECNELVAAAKKANSELFVAHFRRSYPSVLLAQSLIKSNIIGKVTGIEVYEGGKFSWQTQSGYIYKDPYGGVLFDTGSHTIDMALFMTGLDSEEVFESKIKSLKKDQPEPAHHVEAELELLTKNSVIDFKLKLSRRTILSNKVKIIGETGSIDISVQLTNYLRLTGSNGLSTIVHSPNTQTILFNDCFTTQFKEMFYDNSDSIFVASRFKNLTSILEVIAGN